MGIQQSSSSASSTRSYAGASLPPEHGFLTWKMRASLPALKLNSILLALKPDSTKVWLSPKLDATSSICFTRDQGWACCLFFVVHFEKSMKSFEKLVLNST